MNILKTYVNRIQNKDIECKKVHKISYTYTTSFVFRLLKNEEYILISETEKIS